jgi:hypothetical protein
MRISWLSAADIAAAREALTANGMGWEDHFNADVFITPAIPAGVEPDDWARITEHVARAERVSEVVRELGFDEARARFASSTIAIEAATLAAAAHQGEVLSLDQVIGVLTCAIDSLVFYAPFLELMVQLGRADVERTIAAYEAFVSAYSIAIVNAPRGSERIGAVQDGLADYYVSAGRLSEADALFERRHDEDRGDVAVALTASRAFLAAGSLGHAVRWLGRGAERANALGRPDLEKQLAQKQARIRDRLS